MSKTTATAKDMGLVTCRMCSLVSKAATSKDQRCPRCGSRLATRLPLSITRTWAFVIAAWAFVVPSNIYPIMTVVYFGDNDPDTIYSGVISLAEEGMMAIAIIVFIASIVVPVFKLLAIMFLLLVIQLKWPLNQRACTWLYRLIEVIGIWSMLDLFMIAILSALVNIGTVATVYAGPAATAFALVVVFTLFAAMTFDPRLIWDLQEERNND